MLVIRVRDERHRLLHAQVPLHQIAGCKKFGVGLVRPPEPLGSPGREETRVQRLLHGVFAHRELVVAHRLRAAGQPPDENVVLPQVGALQAGPDGVLVRERDDSGDPGSDHEALVGAQLPGASCFDTVFVPLLAEPPTTVQVELDLPRRKTAVLAVALQQEPQRHRLDRQRDGFRLLHAAQEGIGLQSVSLRRHRHVDPPQRREFVHADRFLIPQLFQAIFQGLRPLRRAAADPEGEATDGDLHQLVGQQRRHILYPQPALVEAVEEDVQMVIACRPRLEPLALEDLSYNLILASAGAQVQPERIPAARLDARVDRSPLRPHRARLAHARLTEHHQARKIGYCIKGTQVGVPTPTQRTVWVHQVAAVLEVEAAVPGAPEPFPIIDLVRHLPISRAACLRSGPQYEAIGSTRRSTVARSFRMREAEEGGGHSNAPSRS